MTAKIFDGKKAAEQMKKELKARVNKLKKKGITPSLAFLLVGSNPASLSYIRRKENFGLDIGVEVVHRWQDKPNLEEARSKIDDWNKDPKVHGIIVQLPLPKNWDTAELLDRVDPAKDVDGLTAVNQAKLYAGEKGIVPATPRAVIEILKLMKAPIAHKHTVVIGRSELVGKPAALLLLKEDATVTIAHSKSWHLDRITKSADIIIAAAGVPNLIKPSMVKKGATVIDVGINKLNGKIIGDVSPKVAEVAGRLTPVPGGVGPMTVAMLYANLLDLIEKNL